MHKPRHIPGRVLFRRGLRWLSTAAAGLALCAGPALAVPDQQSVALARQLAQLEGQLAAAAATQTADTAAPVLSVAALVAAAGLTDLVGPEGAAHITTSPTPVGQADAVAVERLNMRLALTMLSQAYGSEDNNDVLAAQTMPDQDALVIRKGRLTLTDLRAVLQDNRLQRVEAGGPLVLTVPLVIWAGASLQLRPGDVLHLSRPDGAFVMNFGHLDVQGGMIAATGGENPRSRDFIPFVTTADGGTVQMQGTVVSGLGFGRTLKFAGFAVMRNSLRSAGPESWIEASTFRDLISVAVSAAGDLTLRGNHFRDMRGSALIVSRSRGTQVIGNLFSGTLPTNAIVLEQGAAKGVVAGNIVLGGQRAGIVVRGGSSGVQVSHNIIWHRDGAGIVLSKSDCGRIEGNLVIENAQKGIEVRDSRGAAVQGNAVMSNHSAGIWVSDQPKGAETLLAGNLLVGNGSGLAAAAGESLRLEGNDFTRQFPQFLSGDLAPQSAQIARNLRGDAPFILTAGGPAGLVTVAATPAACSE